MLIHFIQQHVLADYKPFWCNATIEDEHYNVVTSPTALFYTRCYFIHKDTHSIHSLIGLSYDSSIPSSKVSSPQSVIPVIQGM